MGTTQKTHSSWQKSWIICLAIVGKTNEPRKFPYKGFKNHRGTKTNIAIKIINNILLLNKKDTLLRSTNESYGRIL
jgi:hypothetical protein